MEGRGNGEMGGADELDLFRVSPCAAHQSTRQTPASVAASSSRYLLHASTCTHSVAFSSLRCKPSR